MEDADLVVTPARVESAIHNMDSDAEEDVRDALNINFFNLPETPSAYGTAGQVVQVNNTEDGLIFGAGGDVSTLATVARLAYDRRMIAGIDTIILHEVADTEEEEYEVLRYERMVDGDGNVTWDQVMSGNVRAG